MRLDGATNWWLKTNWWPYTGARIYRLDQEKDSSSLGYTSSRHCPKTKKISLLHLHGLELQLWGSRPYTSVPGGNVLAYLSGSQIGRFLVEMPFLLFLHLI